MSRFVAFGVDVVVNLTASKLGRGGPLHAAIARAARGAEVHETASLAELDDAVRAIARRGSRAVVLAGGDGTHMAGVSALFREMGDAMPVVALAPGGTVCTVARNWGLRGDPRRAAERVVRAAIDGGSATSRPTLRVRDDAGERIGFIFGAGLVAKFFDAYYAEPELGNATAARLVAKIFGGAFVGGALAREVLTPSAARVAIDDVEQAPRAWSLVCASVVRDLGIGMKLTYRAGERVDRVHAVASALGPRALAPQMGRVLAGRPLRGAHHVDALVSELALRFGDDSPARATYVLDGDRFVASEVRVAPGPVLRVVA